MQEEVDQRVVVMIENCSKLTASELRRALEKVLADIRAARSQKLPKQEKEAHGQMTVKELAEKDKGMQSIEVNDGTIGAYVELNPDGPCELWYMNFNRKWLQSRQK